MKLLFGLWQLDLFVFLSVWSFANPFQACHRDTVATEYKRTAVRDVPSDDNLQPLKAWITTRDGEQLVGQLVSEALSFSIGTENRQVATSDLLTFNSAEPASAKEAERIAVDLETLAGTDLKSCEAAIAELSDIGLPVMTPLLKSFQDTDAHEPDYRYRLFRRIVPGFADSTDRTLDLMRLVGGEVFRGKLQTAEIKLVGENGKISSIASSSIRRLAIQRTTITKTFELQALHHCTYVGFLDTGIAVDESSALRADCEGFARLSFDEDGWASDPDGIKEPLSGKRKLQEGFRWGAVLGRVGPTGERWLVGKHIETKELGSGRLCFVINDNEHWQNNIGSYRVHVTVTNAYDLGEPQ